MSIELSPIAPATLEQRSGTVWFWPAVLLLAGIGGLLRFWNIGEKSLWLDEGYTAWVLTLDTPQLIHAIRHDVSPPLYYLLLKAWVGLLGDGEAALRSLSAVGACLTIPLIGMCAWRLTRDRTATLVALALICISGPQIRFAQQARCYGLASLTTIAVIYCLIRRLEGTWRWLIPAGIAAATGVWLHNMMWFYLAALSLAYLMAPGTITLRRRIGEMALLNLAVVASYAIWIPTLLAQMAWVNEVFWAPRPTSGTLLGVLASTGGVMVGQLRSLLGLADGVLWLALGTLLALILLALRTGRRDRTQWTLALLTIAMLPILAVFVQANIGKSYFVARSFQASSVAMPLIAALAIAGRRRALAWVSVGLLALGIGLGTGKLSSSSIEEQDWRGCVAYLNAQPREGTLVVFLANEPEYLYDYYTRRTDRPRHNVTGLPQSFFALTPPQTSQRVLKPEDLKAFTQLLDETRPQRLFLVLSRSEFADPQGYARHLIETRMQPVASRAFNDSIVEEYRPK